MIIIWGGRLCGKVDAVPGVCHVATHFGHLYYIPLIPMRSVIVWGSDGSNDLVSDCGWSLKSILVGWLRGALWVSLVPSGLYLVDSMTMGGAGRNLQLDLLAIGVPITLALSHYLPWIRTASIDRATELAEAEELPEEIRAKLVEAIKKMYIAQGDIEPSRDDDNR